MAPLKIGIAGFRYIAHRHADMLKACSKTKLVAIADPLPDMQAVARNKYGLTEIYDDYKDMIAKSDADAYIIALPVPMHYDATMRALKKDKHVLCEKPPACNVRETTKMVEEAKKRNLVLTWGLQRRFRPDLHAARKAIAQGKLGTIHRVDVKYTLSRCPFLKNDPFRMLKNGGGVFFDLGVHAVDMAWSLLGCPTPTRAVAAHHTVFPEWNGVKNVEDMAEDNSNSLIFFDTGQILTIELCYMSQREENTETTFHTPALQILGNKGGIQTPSLVDEPNATERWREEWLGQRSPTLTFTSGGPDKAVTTTLKTQKSWNRHATLQLIENWAKTILGKDELLIKAEHGIDLMKMIEAVVKSADKQKEVRM